MLVTYFMCVQKSTKKKHVKHVLSLRASQSISLKVVVVVDDDDFSVSVVILCKNVSISINKY